MASLRFHSGLLLVTLMGGYAVTGIAAEVPVIDLSQSAEEKKKRQALQERVEKLERMVQSDTLVDLSMRLDSLQEEVQRLLGEMEVQTHKLEDLKRRQRDLYLDVDRRVQRLESRMALQGTTPAPGPSAQSQQGQGAPTGPGGEPTLGMIPQPGMEQQPSGGQTSPEDEFAGKQDFQQALDLLREGQYEQAASQLQSFVANHPRSEDADDAQYWLGETNYVQNDYDAALDAFKKVVENYPDSPRFADAMLKIGLTYYELQEWGEVKRVFDDLIARFPNTAEAQIAEKRLQRMRLEGR